MSIQDWQSYTTTTMSKIFHRIGINYNKNIESYLLFCLDDDPNKRAPTDLGDINPLDRSTLRDIVNLFIAMIENDNLLAVTDQVMSASDKILDRVLSLLPKEDKNKSFLPADKYELLNIAQTTSPEYNQQLAQLKEQQKKHKERIIKSLRKLAAKNDFSGLTSLVEDEDAKLKKINKECRELRQQIKQIHNQQVDLKSAVYKAYSKQDKYLDDNVDISSQASM